MSETIIPTTADPKNASPFYQVDGAKDTVSKSAALVAETSTALATIIGAALPSRVVGVTIISDGTVQYNPAGAATAASGFLPVVYTVHGGKAFLDTIRLYSAGTPTVTVIAFEEFNA